MTPRGDDITRGSGTINEDSFNEQNVKHDRASVTINKTLVPGLIF